MPARNDFAPGEFCWIDLAAHDLAAAAEWYGKLFGWTLFQQETPGGGPPYGFLMQNGAAVAGIGEMNDEMKSRGVPPLWNTYVCSQDCARTESRARELGANVVFPTTEVPGHGRLAFLTDPEGVTIALWESTNHMGPGFVTMEPGSFSWVELMTRTPDASKGFYADLFGWDYADVPMPHGSYSMIKSGGRDQGGVMDVNDKMFDGMPSHWQVYLMTADCDAATKQVAELGGRVLVPSTPIPVGKFSVVQDPQGGTFSLLEMSSTPC
ncbi:MAG: VOC family protein [Planctomycetota bacterium]